MALDSLMMDLPLPGPSSLFYSRHMDPKKEEKKRIETS